MKKWQIITILIILAIALIYIIPKLNFTGQVIGDGTFSYTRAICDDNNLCEDYIIECESYSVKKLTPTGFTIQQESNWTDNRTPKENLCR